MIGGAGFATLGRVKPWFKLHECDARFFDEAPVRYRLALEVDRPAADVWAELTSDTPLRWSRLLKARWTSARPFGVGTTRTARVLGGAITIDERFFRWDEGRRKSFTTLKASVPSYRRLGEDYVVDELGPTRSRFTWTLAIEPTLIGRVLAPFTTLLVRSFFADTRRHFR